MRNLYPIQITIIGTLFFFFGFITWTNSILIPYLKIACELDNFQSYLVTFAFYIAYFVMAIPSSYILQRTGYKNGIVLGLLICATGTMLFIPAALNRYYLFFLIALYVLGTGLALLQTAANPYITLIGTPEGASTRFNIVGTTSSIAGVAAPYIFGSIILDNADNLKIQAQELGGPLKEALLDSLSHRVLEPYAILTFAFIALAMMIRYSPLPEIDSPDPSKTSSGNLWAHSHLVWGIVALFSYVGVEVLAADSLAGFANSQGYTLEKGKVFVSYCIGTMLLGRFLGIFIMGKIVKPQDLLAFNSLLALSLVVGVQLLSGLPALLCIVALGTCHSIMWAAIFLLAIEGLGSYTKRASSYLIMAIVGGALIPPLYGKLADLLNDDFKTSYLIMLPFYAVILYFGLQGHKVRSKNE